MGIYPNTKGKNLKRNRTKQVIEYIDLNIMTSTSGIVENTGMAMLIAIMITATTMEMAGR